MGGEPKPLFGAHEVQVDDSEGANAGNESKGTRVESEETVLVIKHVRDIIPE